MIKRLLMVICAMSACINTYGMDKKFAFEPMVGSANHGCEYSYGFMAQEVSAKKEIIKDMSLLEQILASGDEEQIMRVPMEKILASNDEKKSVTTQYVLLPKLLLQEWQKMSSEEQAHIASLKELLNMDKK